MDLEFYKEKLPAYLERISVKERSGLYHCPLCGSGTHRGSRSDGAFSVYNGGKNWHCFACSQSGDIFTLIGLVEGLPDFTQQLHFAEELFGRTSGAGQGSAQKASRPEPVQTDFSSYITACMQDAGKTDYWTKTRGFSAETVKRFHLGYDAEKQAVVIPYDSSHTYYITRSIKGKDFRKPKTAGAGREPIYHVNALDQDKTPCFVCESPIDAISIMSAGSFQAIAVGGTGFRKLIDRLEQKKPECPLILSFDADEAGKTASEHLAEELRRIGVPFVTAEYDLSVYPEGMRKDANDFFRGNPAAFAQQLAQNAEAVAAETAVSQMAERSAHDAVSGARRLSGFLDHIRGDHADEAIPTGFSDLDKELDGGLFAGLYVLGAVSSLGKTTFILQAADQIAEAGTDVLYFSLEMSASELLAKSISRQTYLCSGGNLKQAKTVRGILTKSRYEGYSAEEKTLIDKAVLAYQKYSDRLYYYEGIGDIGVAEIRLRTEEHIRLTGRKPVVMIDYLQILAPFDLRATDKTNTDKAVLEMKRMSRDLGVPVLAISSLNRMSYGTGEIEMSAFKESGAIEYGSDVLIGLQVQGIGQDDAQKKINECKEHRIRDVELKILKNRNGQTGGRIGLRYYTLFNCFERDDSYVAKKILSGVPVTDDDFVPSY